MIKPALSNPQSLFNKITANYKEILISLINIVIIKNIIITLLFNQY